MKNLRSLQEKPEVGVLDINGEEGEVLDVPMKTENYAVLHKYLANTAGLYQRFGGRQ